MNSLKQKFFYQKEALIFCILFLGIGGKLFAQDSNLITEIEKAYEAFNYTEAEIKSQAALKNYQDFTTDELTTVHKILGLIAFSKNNTNQADEHFRLALSLTPNLTLDPMLISPKIIAFFDNVKIKTQNPAIPDKQAEPQFRYLQVEDPRPAAAFRSMFFPGWGQFYKKEKNKGRILMTLWTASVISTAATHFAVKSAKDDYWAETEPNAFDSAYDKYNGLYKTRNNLILVSAGIWLFSYFDALYKKTEQLELNESTGVNLTPIHKSNYHALQFTFRF